MARPQAAPHPPWALAALCLMCLLSASHGLLKPSDNMKEIYDLMYKDIPGYPCVRLLHKNGRVGCTAPSGGVVGKVRNILTQSQFDSFVSSPPGDSQVILLHEIFSTGPALTKLASVGKVAGIIVAQNGTRPFSAYSPDLPFPGSFGVSPAPSQVWNQPGDGLTFQEFGFPIWYIKQEYVNDIRQAGVYNEERAGYIGSYAIQINAEMLASGTSTDCIAEGKCLPLGGQSVLATLNAPFDAKEVRRPIVFAATGIDSAAFFHDLSYGADADLSGLVATVAAAYALGPVKGRLASLPRQIAFGAFNGEQWGNIGSRAFVRRLTTADAAAAFAFASLSDVAAVIQARHVGRLAAGAAPDSRRLFRFQEGPAGSSSANDELAALASALAARYPSLVELQGASGATLPPSSLGSFLEGRPGIPHLLLAEHDQAYSNPFFHSRFDGAGQAAAGDVCRAGTFLGRLLYAAAAGNASLPEIDLIQANCAQVEEVLNCFLVDATCSLFRTLLPNLVAPSGPMSLYVSVADTSLRPVPALVGAMFVNASISTASSMTSCSSNSDCPKDPANIWQEYCVLAVRRCARVSVNYSEALSPGFQRDTSYSTLRYKVVSTAGSDPLWAESYWPDGIGIRLFIRSETSAEVGILFLGLGVFGISLFVAWRWSRYYEASMKLS
eukprot:tig00021432_g21209.t1